MDIIDNIFVTTKTQDNIHAACTSGLLEQVLRIYEHEAGCFLAETSELCDLSSSVEDISNHSLPLNFVKSTQCLRNLCSFPDNVVYVQKRGVMSRLSLVIHRLALISPSSLNGDDLEKEYLIKITKFSMQTVSNMTACGIKSISDAIIPEWMPDMLAASTKQKSRAALGASISALYNSIFSATFDQSYEKENDKENDTNEECQRRLENLCTNRPLLCQLILSLLASPGGSNDDNDDNDIVNDPSMEWIGYLAEKLVERERVHQVLTLLGPRSYKDSVWAGSSSSSSGDGDDGDGDGDGKRAALAREELMNVATGLTHEQVIFARIMQRQWSSWTSPQQAPEAGTKMRAVMFSKSFRVGGDMWKAVHAMASILCNALSAALSVCEAEERESAVNNNDANDNNDNNDNNNSLHTCTGVGMTIVEKSLVHSAIYVLMEALGSLLPSWELVESPSVCQLLRASLMEETSVLQRCLELVHGLGTTTTTTTTSSQCQGPNHGVLHKHMHMHMHMFSSKERGVEDVLKQTLCFLGNLLYRCPSAQTAFLRLEGFKCVLPLCATNFDAPLLREWALLCVRNACEGCEENQKYVASLQPQGEAMIQDDALREAGLQVIFDEGTKKFRLRKEGNKGGGK